MKVFDRSVVIVCLVSAEQSSLRARAVACWSGGSCECFSRLLFVQAIGNTHGRGREARHNCAQYTAMAVICRNQ